MGEATNKAQLRVQGMGTILVRCYIMSQRFGVGSGHLMLQTMEFMRIFKWGKRCKQCNINFCNWGTLWKSCVVVEHFLTHFL